MSRRILGSSGAVPGFAHQRDPTPWAAGLPVSVLVAAVSAVAVYAFGAALAQVHPVVSLVVNLVAVGGMAPTAWRWRERLVTRWLLAGVAAGIGMAWCALLLG